MGELAKRRRARDLWISRSHLWAAGVGVLLVVAIAFFGGVTVGRNLGGGGEASGAALTGQVADDSLVELLARVESSADPTGGLEALTFPDELAGRGDGATPPGEGEDVSVRVRVEPGLADRPPSVAGAPSGEFTIELYRTEDIARARAIEARFQGGDLPVWVGAERVDGRLVHRVGLGGYADERSAGRALERIPADLLVGLAPAVVPVRP